MNCIILGRAEAFASKNNAFDSALDGLGIGLGFTLSLTVIGMIREVLGSGAVFGHSFGTATTCRWCSCWRPAGSSCWAI